MIDMAPAELVSYWRNGRSQGCHVRDPICENKKNGRSVRARQREHTSLQFCCIFLFFFLLVDPSDTLVGHCPPLDIYGQFPDVCGDDGGDIWQSQKYVIAAFLLFPLSCKWAQPKTVDGDHLILGMTRSGNIPHASRRDPPLFVDEGSKDRQGGWLVAPPRLWANSPRLVRNLVRHLRPGPWNP